VNATVELSLAIGRFSNAFDEALAARAGLQANRRFAAFQSESRPNRRLDCCIGSVRESLNDQHCIWSHGDGRRHRSPLRAVMAKREAARFLVRVIRSRYRDHRTELAELRRHIRRGEVVCDIGANKGSFLYWLARWATPGRVIAFEPQPDLAEALSRLCTGFSLDNVVVEPTAVDISSGIRDLFVPDGHQPSGSLLKPQGTFKAIEVPTVSLDDYLSENERVSAIKIDVEGAELDVLLGAERTLSRCMPLLIVECDRHLISIERMKETFSFLSDVGYSGSFVSEGKILPLSGFNPDVHQKTEGDWFWKKKGYCNNFVFRKAG
jgi:FkbM family methyltransferase